MMEEIAPRPNVEYIPPPLPPKVRQKTGSTTFTQITGDDSSSKLSVNGYGGSDGRQTMDTLDRGLSSMHPLVLNSKTSSATVFVAATRPERDAMANGADVLQPSNSNGRNHVVTIRINTDADNSKPKISSVHLKSEAEFDTFKLNDICKKNNSSVRINVDDNRSISSENEEIHRTTNEKAPYIYCNSYSMNSITNMIMSSGQCSPSDTLDSGTCSDLDGTPPPLPKKKSSKSSSVNKKAVSVTLIGSNNSGSNHNGEVDFEDNDSNISCDSLNSSELNASVHTEESHNDDMSKKEKRQMKEPPAAPQLPAFTTSNVNNTDSSFLPLGLLQDIRDRSAKLNTFETESDLNNDDSRHGSDEEVNLNINENGNLSKESAQLTSFRLVSQYNRDSLSRSNTDAKSSPAIFDSSKPALISESTYEERMKEDKMKQEKVCYSAKYFDTDKYYDFHLNEKQFDEVNSVKSVSVKRDCDEVDGVEYFAGIKDYKSEEVPSTIRSSKGTIRGVKNRVRAGIATFLQIQSTTKSYKEKDAGKVVIYTTTMGIVRGTYQRCVLVKKILRNLLVKYEERDVFMSVEYQDEIKDRMRCEEIMVPQLFVDGQHVGDADTVEKLNENGDLRKMLKPYKSPDACNTCQMCGGFRLLPCRICNGSKKSLHRNHFTAEFVALKCMNCDEVGLVKCEICS